MNTADARRALYDRLLTAVQAGQRDQAESWLSELLDLSRRLSVANHHHMLGTGTSICVLPYAGTGSRPASPTSANATDKMARNIQPTLKLVCGTRCPKMIGMKKPPMAARVSIRAVCADVPVAGH